MMLSLLLDSALRSLVLGAAAAAMLRLARLSDIRTETAVWTVVLIAALSMPLLSRHVPGLVLTVPYLPAAAAQSAAAVMPTEPQVSGAPTWAGRHTEACLFAIYAVGLMVCATRLAAGLLLTWCLYRRTEPADADWSQGRNIRVSLDLKSPVSLAGAILVTADYREWSAAKRDAVLAHEEAHIARGDFFVQLAARIHCALFWFSPFAWWLQSKLAEIAETASDDAAVRRIHDRAAYAEILVEVSRCAQRTPLIIAMAKSSFIEQRVDHILSEVPDRHLGLPLRALTIVALTALALTVAGAKTVVGQSAPAPSRPLGGLPAAAGAQSQSAEHRVGRPHGAQRARFVSVAAGSSPAPGSRVVGSNSEATVRTAHPTEEGGLRRRATDEPTYNPRALLDPAYLPKPNFVPASTIVHAGKSFYVRSTERPVADVGATYGMDRETRPARNSKKTT